MSTKTKTTSTNSAAIQLNEHSEADRRVLITTQDEDRFSLPCAQAVEACKVHISRKVWFDELDAMLVRVRQWALSHADLVEACYAAPREGRVVIFVVPKAGRYDHALGEIMTDLDVELAQQFRVIESEVMQVPGEPPRRLAAFVNVERATKIYG